MGMKGSGAAELTEIDRFEGGVGWLAYPGETMQRASHAVESGGKLWVIDPVDADGVDDLLAEYGDVGGVVVLLDRHKRDSAAVADRHDVPVYVPEWMSGVESDIDAPVVRFEEGVGEFALDIVVDNPFWQEGALFDGETLVVPEALGTVSYFRAPGERLGVHPMLRAVPPRSLLEYDADRLLVGHGEGVFEDVRGVIREAIDGSRRKMVPLYLDNLRGFIGL
ncbi:hypothetical protein [Natronomonas marina]|uniref:hypothetical protein n=1 Tax=Natronomonas marina TaxID=2961939 RepID=UPI0020C9746A|nr:hypothetical protein [Natronomonas marina]